jgi:hypothetical protein
MSTANEASPPGSNVTSTPSKKRPLSWHMRWLLPVALIPLVVDVAHGLLSRPKDAKLTVTGRHVASAPLGLDLEVPEPWTFLPSQPGADLILQHPDTGAVFLAAAGPAEPSDEPLDKTLEKIIEGRREKWGTLRDIEKNDAIIAGLKGRSATFSLTGPNGPSRVRISMVQTKPYGLIVNCSGVEASFETARQSCDELLTKLKVQAP